MTPNPLTPPHPLTKSARERLGKNDDFGAVADGSLSDEFFSAGQRGPRVEQRGAAWTTATVMVRRGSEEVEVGVPADATPALLGFTMARRILGRAVLTATAETAGPSNSFPSPRGWKSGVAQCTARCMWWINGKYSEQC